MTSITKFLYERIAEDEATIGAAPRNSDYFDASMVPVSDGLRARLIAECATKRDILGFHESVSTSGFEGSDVAWATLNVVLMNMTHPYRNHPDYDLGWD